LKNVSFLLRFGETMSVWNGGWQYAHCPSLITWVIVGQRWIDINKETRKTQPTLLPLCLPQIPHGLPWERTQAFMVRSWRLSAWTISRSRFKTYCWIRLSWFEFFSTVPWNWSWCSLLVPHLSSFNTRPPQNL
jgi:hypothetical protein